MIKKIIITGRLLITISFLFALLTLPESCTKSSTDNTQGSNTGGNQSTGTGTPGPNEVWIQGMAFTPATITVTAGSTITWTNKDAISHTVTSTISLFNSGPLSTGVTFSRTFSEAGTFNYFCSIHPSMTASVIVQ